MGQPGRMQKETLSIWKATSQASRISVKSAKCCPVKKVSVSLGQHQRKTEKIHPCVASCGDAATWRRHAERNRCCHSKRPSCPFCQPDCPLVHKRLASAHHRMALTFGSSCSCADLVTLPQRRRVP